MFDLELAIRLGAALGLGLLLGLERERKRDAELMFGGVRTFALIALLGALGAFMERELDQNWLLVAAFIAVSALVIMSYATTAARGELGITSEISALLAFMVGALCGWDKVAVASVATVVSLLLLTLKDFLHGLARRVELADVEATLQFAVISVIILPLLPNETFGPPPLDVINPYKIWLMVVLIAGLNFLGYVLVKVLGGEHGFVVTGILGGLVSSTAVTLSFSQRSRREPEMASAFVLAIVVAWTIMFVRVVVVVGLVNRFLARDLALALGCMAAAGLLVSLVLWRRSRGRVTGSGDRGSEPVRTQRSDQVWLAVRHCDRHSQSRGDLSRRKGTLPGGSHRRSHRRRCDFPLDGESRDQQSAKCQDRGLHNRHCRAFEYPGEDRNGGVYGRACVAAHDRTGHVGLAGCGSRRELFRMNRNKFNNQKHEIRISKFETISKRCMTK